MLNRIAENKYTNRPVAPGETLSETIETLGMSQSELAKRTGRPEQVISSIINGSKSITPDTSIQLERVLGVPASFWNNLEKNYQEHKAYLASQNKLAVEIENSKLYPYHEMARLGWLPRCVDENKKLENLLSFFAVNSLSTLPQLDYINFRKHDGIQFSQRALAAWLRKGELEAREINTSDFDENKCIESIPEIRAMSTLDDATTLQKELTNKLASCGIAITVVQPLSKTCVSGAARWLTPTKALLQLNLRGKWADVFWFNLFHEIGHIILHSKKTRYVDLREQSKNDIEKEADTFSANSLIPPEEYRGFLKVNNFTEDSIKKFANAISIHPSIVIGRLQHDKFLEFKQMNHLRPRFKFVN